MKKPAKKRYKPTVEFEFYENGVLIAEMLTAAVAMRREPKPKPADDTKALVERLRALHAAASPGPWSAYTENDNPYPTYAGHVVALPGNDFLYPDRFADAEFIAAAHNEMPALLARIDEHGIAEERGKTAQAEKERDAARSEAREQEEAKEAAYAKMREALKERDVLAAELEKLTAAAFEAGAAHEKERDQVLRDKVLRRVADLEFNQATWVQSEQEVCRQRDELRQEVDRLSELERFRSMTFPGMEAEIDKYRALAERRKKALQPFAYWRPGHLHIETGVPCRYCEAKAAHDAD